MEYGSYYEIGGDKKQQYLRCDELEKFIWEDNRKAFVGEIRRLLEMYGLEENLVGLFTSSLFVFLVRKGARKCGEALLKGETGLVNVNLNTPLTNPYLTHLNPLHFAAKLLSPSMTELFLKYGAKADVRCKDGFLPLDLALQSFGRRVYWPREESVYCLLFDICGPRMLESLKTVHCLVNYLSAAELSDAISRYGVEGKIIELATLLVMVPNKSLWIEEVYVPPDANFFKNTMTLREYVVNKFVSLANLEHQLGGVATSSTRLAEHEQKKHLMTSTMILLEIFRRIGPFTEGSVCEYSILVLPSAIILVDQ